MSGTIRRHDLRATACTENDAVARVLRSVAGEEVYELLELLAETWKRSIPHTARTLLRRGLNDRALFGVCRDCGGTSFNPRRYGCFFVDDDLCSACAAEERTEG